MAKEKDNVLLWHSFIDIMLKLNDEETKEILRAFKAYIKGEPISFTQPKAEGAWLGISLQLDADKENYNDKCEKNKQRALDRWYREKNQMPTHANNANAYVGKNGTQKQKNDTNNADTDTDTDIYKEKIYKKEKVEEIYELYPRKVGKPAAIKAIENAISKVDVDFLLNRTRAYNEAVKSYPESEKQFIPHPATWFNQERYNDEPDTWIRSSLNSCKANELTILDFKTAYRWLVQSEWDSQYPTSETRIVKQSKTIEEIREKIPNEYSEIKRRLANPVDEMTKAVRRILGRES